MPTKGKEMQYLIRQYRETTGIQDVEMHEVAKFAVGKGWPLPKPRTALDRLALQFSAAAPRRNAQRRGNGSSVPRKLGGDIMGWRSADNLLDRY